MAFWGLIGVGLTMESAGVGLLAATENSGWQTLGYVLLILGVVALGGAVVARLRGQNGDGGGVVSADRGGTAVRAGRDAYTAGRDIHISGPEAKKTDDRHILPITAQRLVGFYRVAGQTTMQADALFGPYIGQWMRVEGAVNDVSRHASGRILVSLDVPGDGDTEHVIADFDGEPWIERASTLSSGDKVKVVGQIRDATANYLGLEACELE